ncbi:unnamed protein product [Symbiodinium natans]|uniref:Uncharacterized protein n=1 Tax=Symbiodinium natans TaxID=878477 RepID=A0A812PCW0_9DINO|nr:unnamed protein product [Symbiodinium natans]
MAKMVESPSASCVEHPVIVQLLGCRQELSLKTEEPSLQHQALTQLVAQHFEVSPPFSFSSDQGAFLEDAEALAEAVKAGSVIVVHLGATALHDFGRRVRQLRNLQWGLVSQQLEKVRVESVVHMIPGGACSCRKSAETILGEQFAEFRLEVKQTLQLRLENLQEAMEQRLRRLEESWEQRLGSALAAMSSERSPKEKDPEQRAEFEGLSDLLRTECKRVAESVDDLREECREALQREVRARLEHHRKLQEEFRQEAKARLQVASKLEQEIQAIQESASSARSTSCHEVEGVRQRVLVEPRREVLLPFATFAEPVTAGAGSPMSSYPASLHGETPGSPGTVHVRLPA